jgi:hypothetical protein
MAAADKLYGLLSAYPLSLWEYPQRLLWRKMSELLGKPQSFLMI